MYEIRGWGIALVQGMYWRAQRGTYSTHDERINITTLLLESRDSWDALRSCDTVVRRASC